MPDYRIFFVTDLHGSTRVLEKAMNEARRLRADVLVACGDLGGKYLLFVEQLEDKIVWEDPVLGTPRRTSRSRLPEVLDDIAAYGAYGVLVEDRGAPSRQSDQSLTRLFENELRRRLVQWIASLEAFSRASGVKVIMMAGNDDARDVDDLIAASPIIGFCDERSWQIDGYRFIGISCVPPTPWATPREASEEEIAARLRQLPGMGTVDLPCVLVAHTPPYACGLDNAPLLDTNNRQVILGGVVQTTPVGSRSLRTFLEERDDVPLALHGHVHESAGWARVGATLCLNPGTEYFAGILSAYFVVLNGRQVVRFQRVGA